MSLCNSKSSNKSRKFFGHLNRIIMTTVAITVLLLSQNVIVVAALTQAQKDAIKSGARYYNTEEEIPCVCTATPASSGGGVPIGSLEEVLQNWEADNPGSGLAVRNITDNATAEVNGASVKTSASVYKLFVARALYLLRANNGLSFNTTVNIGSYVNQAREENTKDGYTTWPWGNRTQIPISECLPEMISKSENACGWALRDFVNQRGYNSYGNGTTMDPQRTTALDVVNLLQQVAQGTMVNRQSSEELEQMLENQLHRNKIPAGIPSGVQVGNKTGEYHEGDGQLVSNDTAIVRADGVTYVIAILTSLNADSESDTAKIADLSRQVYEVLTGGSTSGGSTVGGSTVGGAPCPTVPSADSQGQAGSVYLIGDSIGGQIDDPLGSQLGDGGGSLSPNVADGRNLQQGIEAIEGDEAEVRGADSVIIQLGTNASTFTAANVGAMVNKVREFNPDVKIYWVDTATTNSALATSLSNVNRIIHDQSGSSNYQVISWNKAVFGESANPSAINPAADDNGYIRNADSRVHLSPEGITAMTELIVSALAGGASNTQTAPECACSAATANSSGNNKADIWNFLIGKGLTEIQTAGIMGNMQHESGFEPQRQQSIHDRLVPAENFPDPAGGEGWGIVQWTPGSKMIDTFNPPSQANSIMAQLDFLWGQLTGTGPAAEDPRILSEIKSATTLLNAVLAFQGTENPDVRSEVLSRGWPLYRGFERPADEVGSVDNRLTNAEAILSEFTGTSGAPGATSGCGVGNGIVNPDGYAYPVAPLRQDTRRPNGSSHADDPVAWDFMRPGGTAVYAIYDGTVVPTSNGEYYRDVPGCYRINFNGDDGYKYWYGHLQNIMVRDNTHVEAGTQIAEVADNSLGPVCHGRGPGDDPASHLHLDRGYPAGIQGGGSPFNRNDPNFIPLLQRLYDALPQ